MYIPANMPKWHKIARNGTRWHGILSQLMIVVETCAYAHMNCIDALIANIHYTYYIILYLYICEHVGMAQNIISYSDILAVDTAPVLKLTVLLS